MTEFTIEEVKRVYEQHKYMNEEKVVSRGHAERALAIIEWAKGEYTKNDIIQSADLNSHMVIHPSREDGYPWGMIVNTLEAIINEMTVS
ncbi:MAG: hypothetical protein HN356_07025 [Calditrichaeota bacterium]|jgi:transketolase N-terminal domain/subunit|nr:hypothetical protein [Calditrichota bacterium]MBT7617998.1 hypothetical protein [Calditrichota bacterium]MBT7789282.1 hypothetical protein [Calditrichota bacterium]